MVKSTFLVSPLRHLVGWVFQRTKPQKIRECLMVFPWVSHGFSQDFPRFSPPSWSPACISQYGHDRLGYFGWCAQWPWDAARIGPSQRPRPAVWLAFGGETMAISDLDLLNTWDLIWFNGTLFQYVSVSNIVIWWDFSGIQEDYNGMYYHVVGKLWA